MPKKKKIVSTDKQDMTRIVLFTLGIYFVMLVVVYSSGGPTGCNVGREVEEGCAIGFPFTLLFFVPALICGSVFFIMRKQRKLQKTKNRKRR